MAKMTNIAKRLPRSRSIPSTTPQDREAKRLHILEAAAAEFALYGFDTADVEEADAVASDDEHRVASPPPIYPHQRAINGSGSTSG